MGKVIGGFFVLLLSIGMLVGAFFLTRSNMAFRATALHGEGTVVDFSEETKTENGKTTTMYKPIIEFTAKSGKTIRFNSDTSSSSPSYNRGDKVTVLYQENTPERARMDSFMSNWGATLILSILGLVFMLVGAGLVMGGLSGRK